MQSAGQIGGLGERGDRGGREFDGHCESARGERFRVDAALVRADDGGDDRESEPEPWRAPRPCFVSSVEAIEQGVDVFGVELRAGIRERGALQGRRRAWSRS